MTLRLVTFTSGDSDRARVGALVNETVIDLDALANQPRADLPANWENSLVSVLAQPDWVAWARQAMQNADEQQLLDRSSVRLLPPVPRPGKIFLLAGNYVEHLRETASFGFQKEGEVLRQVNPQVFTKPPDTLIGDGDPIILARNHRFVDYEAELAVIIGKAGRHISPDEALYHLAGISAFNDVSEREWGADAEGMTERDRFFAWLNGKWFDTFSVLGPCAVPMVDIPDIHDLHLRLYLNDELKQDATTALMIFDVPTIIAYISSIITLRPGDIIATGTPAGVGHPQGLKLQDRDIVRIELDLVGSLTNPVQAEA